MKIAYMGSGTFATNILEKLLQEDNIQITKIITQPAKPFGRKKQLLATELKQFVDSNNLDIPTFECSNSKQILEILEPNEVEFLVVCDYGVLLKQAVLDLPSKYCLNVHGSLLPHLRGASPVQMTIYNQDQLAGICVQEMVLKLDAGPVFMSDSFEVDFTETTPDLISKLSIMGANILIKTLNQILDDNLKPVEQNPSEATFCSKIPKEMGCVNFLEQDAKQIFAAFRAFISWPGIYFVYDDVVYKVLDCKIVSDLDLNPGEFSFTKKQMFVGCLNGTLEILKIQPQGKKEMDVSSFVAGYKSRFV